MLDGGTVFTLLHCERSSLMVRSKLVQIVVVVVVGPKKELCAPSLVDEPDQN